MKQPPAARQAIARISEFLASDTFEPNRPGHDTVTALEPRLSLGYAGAVTGSAAKCPPVRVINPLS